MRIHAVWSHVVAVVAVVAALATTGLAGCASDLATRPLTPVEAHQAAQCEQLIGVERLGCIQQTAGRPGSPYDAAGRPVSVTAVPDRR